MFLLINLGTEGAKVDLCVEHFTSYFLSHCVDWYVASHGLTGGFEGVHILYG